MLRERQQNAIELVHFEGMTFGEAATKTGESLSAIRRHYYRGTMKLRETFKLERRPTLPLELEDVGRIHLEVRNLKPRTI